jgi:hypothetical protein
VKFLAVSHNIADPSPFLEAEAARTAELQRSGVFERVLLKADWSGAVVVVDAEDALTARAAIDSLPLARNGITHFELTQVVEPPAAG